ncbi:MAG: hypothetical protein IJW85_01455 [Clostridia bacterium]|nr:hypothetical protein [Clostridia bacterium]MBQ8899566.1 hypothetical protein [Akkermansia sp.]
MAEHINIAPREHVEKRITMEAKPGDAYSESTGRKETTKYTGAWADMLTQATDLIGGGGGSVQVTCELERLEGGIGELTVTRETYRQPDATEEEEPEQPETEQELGSEGAPCYTCSSSTVQECILAHPKFENLEDLPRRALKAMIDGQDEYSFLEDGSSESGFRTIKDCIGNDPAAKLAFKLIGKGITAYLNVQTEITARWKGRSNNYTVGTIVATPPGNFKAQNGRDYLVVGTGMEKTGKETWCSATFRMSGEGGWKKELYSDS